MTQQRITDPSRVITDAERMACTFLGQVTASNYRLGLWIHRVVSDPSYQQPYDEFVADPSGLAATHLEEVDGGAPLSDHANTLLTEQQIRTPRHGAPELDRELHGMADAVVSARCRGGVDSYSGTVGSGVAGEEGEGLYTYEGSLTADVTNRMVRIANLLEWTYCK